MAKPQLLEEVGKVSELKTNDKTVVGGINEVLEKEKSNEEQINVLNSKTYVTSGGGISEYDEPTKPSDYEADSFRVRRLRKCDAVGASSYGFWISIIGLRGHGGSNCFELGFTNNNKLIYRNQNETEDLWNDWKQIVTVDMLNNALAINNLTQSIGGTK